MKLQRTVQKMIGKLLKFWPKEINFFPLQYPRRQFLVTKVFKMQILWRLLTFFTVNSFVVVERDSTCKKMNGKILKFWPKEINFFLLQYPRRQFLVTKVFKMQILLRLLTFFTVNSFVVVERDNARSCRSNTDGSLWWAAGSSFVINDCH